MKTIRLLAVLILLTVGNCFGAGLTDYYVSFAGSGDGTGSDAANSMTWTNFCDYMKSGGTFAATNGSRFNLKNDVYPVGTTNITWDVSGYQSNLIIIRGYATTPGDGYQGRTNGNGPLITTNMPLIQVGSGTFAVSGSWIVIESLRFTLNNALYGIRLLTGANGAMMECSVTQSNTTAATATITGAQNDYSLFNCDVSSINEGPLKVISSSGLRQTFIGCRITANATSAMGAQLWGNSLMSGCTVFNCGVGVTNPSTSIQIIGNTITGCSGDGIQVSTNATLFATIINNSITDNGGYGINFQQDTNGCFTAYNRLRDNTLGNINPANTFVAYGNVTTDTGGPEQDYVNAAANDYRLVIGSASIYAGIPYPASIGANEYLTNCTGGASAPVTTSHSFVR